MKTWLKRIGCAGMIPVVGTVSLAALLYIPPVGNRAGKFILRCIGKKSGMDIRAERVTIAFPADVTVSGAEVLLPSGDTLFAAERLRLCIIPNHLIGKIISVDTLTVRRLRIATGNLVEGMELKGVAGALSAKAMIRLAGERITVSSLSLADASVSLRIDSLAPEDPGAAPFGWTVEAGRLVLDRIRFAMQIPAGTLALNAAVERGELIKAVINPAFPRYAAERLRLSGASLAYDGDARPPATGFDPAHLFLDRINAAVDSFVYEDRKLNVRIEAFSLAERSGAEISLRGRIDSDSLRIHASGFQIQTPSSSAGLRAVVPWYAWDKPEEGNMQLSLAALIGKGDLELWGRDLPDAFLRACPDVPLSVAAAAEGNLSSIILRQLTAELPGAFSLSASGVAGHVSDNLRRSARIQMEAQAGKLDFVLNLLPASQREGFRIPEGISLSGGFGLKDSEYSAGILLSGATSGSVALDAHYHALSETYGATLTADSLLPVRFMPGDSLMRLSATLRAEGRGTDVFADSARCVLEGRLSDVRYASTELKDVRLHGSLENHHAQLRFSSAHPFARMDLSFDGSLRRHSLQGMCIGNVDSLDLEQLRLTDMPFATSFQLFAEMESDFDVNHRADLTLGNWELNLAGRTVKPKMLTFHARTDRDTTRLSFHAGDFGIVLTGNTDVKTLTGKLSEVAADAGRQIREDSSVDVAALRPLLPDMRLAMHAEKDNPIYNILQQYDIDVDAFRLDASSSPERGLCLDAAIYTLYRDTFRIDTLRASIRPDTAGLRYRAEVIKNRYRRQEPFTAEITGSLKHRYADAELLYKNSRNETGLRLGVRGTQEADGILLRLFPENPVVAFNAFTLNPDNYIRYRSPKNIEANVRFTGNDNSSLWLHSFRDDSGDSTGLAELHAELNRIDMDAVSEGFSGMPRMKGTMSADLRYAPSEESFMIVGDVLADSLSCEGTDMGELMLNTIYLPLDENTHQVDAHFYHNRKEVASATAVYEAKREQVDGSIAADTLPVALFTPFIPDRIASLNGALNGRLALSGSPGAPLVNGYVQIDTGSVYTGMAASRFRLDGKRLEIKNSRALFDSFKVYSAGTNPLELNGDINFVNPARITADLRLKGNSIQALDVKRNPESLVYGRLLMDVSATVQGRPEALNVRGDIRLLGGTNLAYVMKESPLTVQDRLKDLVTFTSFADTTLRRRRAGGFTPVPVSGMDMLMQIHIDPIVQLRADLTPDQSSFVVLEGGGDLSFQYTRQGDMLLNGRYTLSDGRLKYALPVIPLKEFRIRDESYIQWDGNPANPILSLAATQRMRTSASLQGESPRMVNFDVGIDVRQRLENMSLLFTIAAPEDMAMQSELDRMGAEGRSTQAVAMMATGLYLGSGNAGKVNLDMGNALGSFLQNEINSIAGDALGNMDFSFGMNTYNEDGQGSGQRTDYSFRFAKRFYNDRLRVVIGGKVSTGDVQQKESFIDNASLEWRLNKAGTGYLKVFHDKNYQSILDGEVTETGLGVVFRRKMRYWYELFK